MQKVFVEAFKQAIKFFGKPTTLTQGVEKVMKAAAKTKIGKTSWR